MSSIIDALKKSDKNRTTDNGAQVNSINFSNEPPAKSRRGFWLLVVFLLFVASGVFAWQRGWHHIVIGKVHQWLGNDNQQQIMQKPQPIQPVKNTDQPKNDQPKVSNTQQAPKQEPVSTQKNNRLTPPKTAEVKAQSAITPLSKNTDQKAEEQIEKEQNTQEITDLKQHETATQTEEKPAESADTIQPIVEQKNDRKVLEPQLKQDYLLIHQLDFEIRRNIPPIKLNIHIFDPDPANRMVIMNGVKFVTGDVIEELVKVKEIVKEGVVLEFENIRFLIPK